MNRRKPTGSSVSQNTRQPPSASASDEHSRIMARCWKIISDVTVSSDNTSTIAEAATPARPSATGLPRLARNASRRDQMIQPVMTGRK